MTSEVVLVEHWQHGCCGDVVALGDVVTWRLKRDFDRDWLTRTYGAERVARLTAVEERHGDESPGDEVVQARVIGLSSVTCRLRPAPDNSGLATYSADDGGRVESRRTMVRWEPEAEEEVWAGYIVELMRT